MCGCRASEAPIEQKFGRAICSILRLAAVFFSGRNRRDLTQGLESCGDMSSRLLDHPLADHARHIVIIVNKLGTGCRDTVSHGTFIHEQSYLATHQTWTLLNEACFWRISQLEISVLYAIVLHDGSTDE